MLVCYNAQKEMSELQSIQVRPVSAVEAVCAALENDIYSINYLPGERIVEGDLASRYCVSRNTVREAVAFLISSGLLVKEVNKGIYVRKINSDDIREIFHLRELLENEAIRMILSCEAIPVELMQLAEKIEHIDPVVDWDAHIDADIAFHETLIKAAKSTRLAKLYDCIIAEVKLCIYQSHTKVPTKKENIHQHQEILKAMRQDDLQTATYLMSQHIESAIRSYEACFRASETT